MDLNRNEDDERSETWCWKQRIDDNKFDKFLLFFLVCLTVAPTGDHVISLIDEISYLSPPAPLLSQYDDINPEQFCNGDNRPANCGNNCMCTHKIDIPLNAIVEIVLVDEGNERLKFQIKKKMNWKKRKNVNLKN